MFDERKYDRKLNIDTHGIVEWPLGVNIEYFRTESTLYSDLDRFIEQYDMLPAGKLVDFGSGKGRILYYFNYRYHIPTTGIELSEVAYHQLVNNFASYSKAHPGLAQKVTIHKMKAEDYEIKPDENLFYFFNPFTLKIFKRVLQNIEKSLVEQPRTVDIIIYYPSVNYTSYLDNYTDFHLIQLVKTPKYFINSRECFKVYRYHPSNKDKT